MKKDWIELPRGMKVEFIHRHCPRCGLDLTQQVPEADADEQQAEGVEQHPGHAGIARMPGDFVADADARLQRMVAPLTEAEKERAQRNEQRWLAGQAGQQPGSGQQKHGEAGRHQHFVPMIKSKFFEWIRHAWKFITRADK